MAKKTYDKKDDFIKQLMSMTAIEMDQFIKANGKPPKKVRLYHLTPIEEYENYEKAKVI